MTDSKRTAQVTREAILMLLSDDENGKVSTAEAAAQLVVGSEYLDLENLDRGVQRADAATRLTMGQVLPRAAIRDETWNKILARLAG